MSFLKKLQAFFMASPSTDKRYLWLYVQCDKCGEVLRGRVDLYNEVSDRFEDGVTSYFCRKVFIGSRRCYRPIEVELTFDKNKRLIRQEINGGKLVGEEDYLQDQAQDKA